jgi:hypothetical protein
MMSSGRARSKSSGRGVDVDPVGIVLADREVEDRGRLGRGVPGDVIAEGAHRLRGEVAALDDVVVHDRPDAPRLRLAIVAVQVVHHRAEDGHVGHLPADHACLDLSGAEEPPHLLDEVALDSGDEVGALVVVDVGVHQRSNPLVFGVAERGVHDR